MERDLLSSFELVSGKNGLMIPEAERHEIVRMLDLGGYLSLLGALPEDPHAKSKSDVGALFAEMGAEVTVVRPRPIPKARQGVMEVDPRLSAARQQAPAL